MKERPILFSGPMVRAILSGVKTQTRRVVKGQINVPSVTYGCIGGQGFGFIFGDQVVECPYGEPGDRLWVRETFCDIATDHRPVWFYRADGDEKPDWVKHWRPSIFMPQAASRLTLEIVSVRVERLCDISGMDAWHEGCPYHPKAEPTPDDVKAWYRDLWESINGEGSWASNPWVWVVEFNRVTP